MSQKYRQQMISLHKEVLQSFKEFCSRNHWPLSRFLSIAGQEKLAREKKEGFE